MVIALAVGLLLTGVPTRAQVDYYAPDNVRSFAEYLLAEGDYLRAAGEFERYYVMVQNRAKGDSILYQIARCYTLAGRPNKALTYYQTIIDRYPGGGFIDQAVLGAGWSYFQRGAYRRSLQTVADYPVQQKESRVPITHLMALDYLHLKQWTPALDILTPRNTSADTLGSSLAALARRGLELPYKSRIVAGMLSAVVPGSGRMYAGRFTDGLYSLLVVGTTGWQAYEGFHDDGVRSTRGWIYGAVCGFFYLGNVYGSVVAVKIHNDRLELNLLRDADDLVEKLIP
ncbi:tol-pal system YbgF family protein [Candidatus Zixiibacteriota bacterium]